MKFAIASAAAIFVAFAVLCEAHPNYSFNNAPENWRPSERALQKRALDFRVRRRARNRKSATGLRIEDASSCQRGANSRAKSAKIKSVQLEVEAMRSKILQRIFKD